MKFNFHTMTIKEIGKSLLGYLGLALILVGMLCGSVYAILSMTKENYSYQIFRTKAELSYFSAKDNLMKAVDEYIDSTADESAMNGIAFIEQCDKYNVDLIFALAQAHLESHFATRGVAEKTKSAFNVLAYDGRSADDMIKKGHCYKHPDKSIEPYLKLLTTRYLVNGVTEMDLLNKFVDCDGHRYASVATYEQSMREKYNAILTNTNINALYGEYQKYKMICEK